MRKNSFIFRRKLHLALVNCICTRNKLCIFKPLDWLDLIEKLEITPTNLAISFAGQKLFECYEYITVNLCIFFIYFDQKIIILHINYLFFLVGKYFGCFGQWNLSNLKGALKKEDWIVFLLLKWVNNWHEYSSCLVKNINFKIYDV